MYTKDERYEGSCLHVYACRQGVVVVGGGGGGGVGVVVGVVAVMVAIECAWIPHTSNRTAHP